MTAETKATSGMRHLLVPIDRSGASWRAADVAFGVAGLVDASVTLLGIVRSAGDLDSVRREMESGLRLRDLGDAEVDLVVRLARDSVPCEILHDAQRRGSTTVVMSSYGRGRSSAIVGGVTDGVLRGSVGPTLLVGPAVIDTSSMGRGPVVIGVDGSVMSERSVPHGVDWAADLGVEPWIVHAGRGNFRAVGDAVETGYVTSLARAAEERAGVAVRFEELHGRRAVDAIVGFARDRGASIVVVSSHGRTGIERLTMGSVTAGLVRSTPCPILVVTPAPRAASGVRRMTRGIRG